MLDQSQSCHAFQFAFADRALEEQHEVNRELFEIRWYTNR